MLGMRITILVLFYFAQLYDILAELKVEKNQLEFPDEKLIFGHESFKSGKITYAVCKNNYATNEQNCKVIREKAPFSNDTFVCNITFRVPGRIDNGTEDNHEYGILPFGKNKAIFYIIQISRRTKARLNTIQLDSCTIVEKNITVSKYVISKYSIVIVPYRNSYDVVYPSVSRGFQKLTINARGEHIHGPVEVISQPWLAHFPFILPVSERSRRKGYVYLSYLRKEDDPPNVYEFNTWKPEGVEQVLGRHKIILRSLKSTSYDLIGICHDDGEPYNQVRCAQYGSDGRFIFETDLLGHENQTIAFAHNRPEGGFFLLGGEVNNETGNIDFSLIKLDSDGKNSGSISLGEMVLKAEALVSTFYKIGYEEYCISVADYNAVGVENSCNNYYIHRTVHCFSDSDFVLPENVEN